jgi:O-antigen ligase
MKIDKQGIHKYLNYLIIAFAFSFPISKAGVNILEFLLVVLWIYEGNWSYKLQLLKSNKFMIAFALFMLYIFISIFWASNTHFAIQYFTKYHHYLLLPVIYTSLDKKYIKYVFYAFISSMFISELMSYGIYFGFFTYGQATPEFPTPFMHHITYSVVLAFTSTILLVSALSEKNLYIKIFDTLFFMTVVTNLFLNGGRTGQIIFIVLIFTVLLMYIKNKLKAMLIATMIVVMTFFLAYNFSKNFASRVHQFENGISKMINHNDFRGQGGMRAAMWIVGSEVFIHNPIIGTGIGNVMHDANYYVSKHNFKARNMKGFADYHNVFINIAAQLGLIGLSLLLYIFYTLYKLEFKTKKYAILNRTFLISFILFSCTHNTVHLMFPMVFLALFSGLFTAISRLENSK